MRLLVRLEAECITRLCRGSTKSLHRPLEANTSAMRTPGAANLRRREFHQSLAGAVGGSRIDHGTPRHSAWFPAPLPWLLQSPERVSWSSLPPPGPGVLSLRCIRTFPLASRPEKSYIRRNSVPEESISRVSSSVWGSQILTGSEARKCSCSYIGFITIAKINSPQQMPPSPLYSDRLRGRNEWP
jgi:hypothetical protein